MEFKPGDVIHAQVTKADVKQEAGLKLEDRHGRIYVRKIEGLFKRREVPVIAGDELLKRNIQEIKHTIKQELKIMVVVQRNDADDSSRSTASVEEPDVEESEVEESEVEESEEYLQLEYSDIRPGDIMMLQGLNAKPELNGLTVEVLQEADKPGRWQVEVQKTGAVFAVKADKLVPIDESGDYGSAEEEEALRLENGPANDDNDIVPGVVMKLFKLKKKAKMNGTVVKVLYKADKPDRWEVEVVDTKQVMSIARHNLRHF
jgi:hypothetical protein